MHDPDDTATDFDDYDVGFGPELDSDISDFDDDVPERDYVQSAWQRLDERRDAKWLKDQLSDWDDWDDDAGLH